MSRRGWEGVKSCFPRKNCDFFYIIHRLFSSLFTHNILKQFSVVSCSRLYHVLPQFSLIFKKIKANFYPLSPHPTHTLGREYHPSKVPHIQPDLPIPILTNIIFYKISLCWHFDIEGQAAKFLRTQYSGNLSQL